MQSVFTLFYKFGIFLKQNSFCKLEMSLGIFRYAMLALFWKFLEATLR